MSKLFHVEIEERRLWMADVLADNGNQAVEVAERVIDWDDWIECNEEQALVRHCDIPVPEGYDWTFGRFRQAATP